ncbi:HAD hydrolase-like protein [uncultured Bifidobacterium sp.]|uniref:HAD hydrolase-like protein n=1 Tax=uncultured Bifidobacterium sp. TaxID=165187 RepID=UPI002626DB1F|nr:HAD hydrolase-like protein [uncultured Bifidobacterium sp.]
MRQSGTGRRIVLLDLDGTLTKSDPGIIASAEKALETLGFPVPDKSEMRRFIGPAIIESMRRNNVPEDRLDEAVRTYRRYYSEEAVFDDPLNPGHKVPGSLANSVYSGIPDQLRRLRTQDFILAVATCKPEYQARPICEHFGLDDLVDDVFGASRDNSRITKASVIRYAFSCLRYSESSGDRALMVGDRWTDADGARDCSLDCLGCAWGYAESGELEEHGAYRVIDHVDDLDDAVSAYFN